jgi:hypothetical protein
MMNHGSILGQHERMISPEHKMSQLKYIALLFCMLGSIHLSAQFPGQERGVDPARDSTFANSNDWVKIDSIDLYYTFADDPDHKILTTRDTMDFLFHQYDPARRQDLFYQNLGNVGSPARSQLFKGPEYNGLHSGIHQYDIYLIHPENFKYYDTNIPLSDFYASQGNSQNDGMITARFGRNFAKGVKMSILYGRINQEGLYLDQRTKNTNLGVGVQVDGENGNYDGYYGYLSNSIIQENNGGITSYDSLASPFRQIRKSMPVFLEDALSTLRERTFFSTHYFHIRTKGDSIRERKPILDIKYAIQFKDYFYKYADQSIGTSTAYYGEFMTDDRGIRTFVEHQKLINELGFSYNINPENRIFGSVEHRLVTLNQEPITDNRNEVYINGKIESKLFKRFGFKGTGYLGILDASANFNLQGKASLDLKKFGTFGGAIRIHQRRPDLIEESLFVNQIPVWQEDFKNINTNLVEVSYTNPNWNLEAALRWWIVDNYIYYGNDFKPVQLSNSLSIQQFYAKGSYQIWHLALGASIGLQNTDVDEIALPSFIFEGSAALTGRIFKKKLRYQLGVDLRFTNEYNGVGYYPLSGQFHLNDSKLISAYPAMDAFIAIQINSLKVYFKSENISSNWSNDYYDQIIGYPQFEAYFRFGFGFQLYN